MWCYQKPGFQALLLAELQRQQQCSQFCDTLLKTEGVSVPAHSFVLSAISPQISSALSATPPPPPGQSRLLDFRALGARTLLHMVSLLYSGEMAGEGEKEKREAVSAAAKLGIHGLVEVIGRDRESRHGEEKGQRAEVAVKTAVSEESEGRRVTWRGDMRDGETLLWKETPSDGGKDTCALTEELLVNTAPSFDTINLAALQSFGETDPNLLSTHIPYVPVTLVYPPNENQAHQLSSAPVDYLQSSTAAGQTPVVVVAPPHISGSSSIPPLSSQANLCAPSCWANPQGADTVVAAVGESEDERLKQFQDNIPGYINYFLNPDIEEDSHRGRARGRRRSQVASASRAGTVERGARRRRGRGGGLTQTVDVQDVGVSRLQKLYLQRSGRRASKTGQGGGAAGRSLYVKSRELLKPTRGCRRRRVLDTFLEVSPIRDVLPRSERGAGNTKRGPKRTTPQSNQRLRWEDQCRKRNPADRGPRPTAPQRFTKPGGVVRCGPCEEGRPVSRPRRSRAKPTSPPLSSPPMQSHNVRAAWASSPSLRPSPSPSPLSPATSYVPLASSLLHTASAWPPAPPPPEEQPENINRLLEEVMMELDILPKSNNHAPHPHPLPLPPANSSSCTPVSVLAQNEQQSQVVAVVARGAASSYSANVEAQILLEQGEGVLENFLLSFEKHIDSCTARQEEELGGQSCSMAPVSSSQSPQRQRSEEDEAPAGRSQPLEASSGCPAPDKHVERVPGRRRQKRRKKAHMCSSHSRQSPDVKDIAKTKTGSSVKSQHDSLSGKNQTVWRSIKAYPLRSKFKARRMDNMPVLAESRLQSKGSPSAGQTGRWQDRPRREDGQLLSLSNGESSTPPVQPQAVEPCGAEKQVEMYEERQEQEVSVLPQDEAEATTRRGRKRGAEAEEEASDDGAVAKRVGLERMPELSSEACTPSSESVETEPAVFVHVETAYLTRVRDCSPRRERKEKRAWSEIKLRKMVQLLTCEENLSSDEEIIDVDGGFEDDRREDAGKDDGERRTAPALLQSVEMKSSLSAPSHPEVSHDEDEDVDVVGGCSPAPEPVSITWTESSEGEDEDEDVDLVRQVLATISTCELVNRKYQTEVL